MLVPPSTTLVSKEREKKKKELRARKHQKLKIDIIQTAIVDKGEICKRVRSA
jgi:hypothetical protein